ncbi:transmembrane protein 107 [Silurus meridionalis]|nr:transmembrane protein 107 [Silurus meridionalis]
MERPVQSLHLNPIELHWDEAYHKGNNVKSCLPLDFTEEQYTTEDNRLIISLSVTLFLFAIELFGFFSGVSMFNSNQGVLSMVCHCSASVSLSFFVFQQWECWVYWIIFAFCRSARAIHVTEKFYCTIRFGS